MVLLRIDPDGAAPLHIRIAAAVRRALADGELKVGNLLPAARDLADSLGVNVNTVLRAYRDLRDEGLVELRRGRGATVRGQAPDRARLTGLADSLLSEAARLGISRAELVTLLKERS